MTYCLIFISTIFFVEIIVINICNNCVVKIILIMIIIEMKFRTILDIRAKLYILLLRNLYLFFFFIFNCLLLFLILITIIVAGSIYYSIIEIKIFSISVNIFDYLCIIWKSFIYLLLVLKVNILLDVRVNARMLSY